MTTPAPQTRLSYVSAFADAESHGERADLLLRMPLATMQEYRMPLAATCKATGFTPGEDYIAAVCDALLAQRGPDGNLPDAVSAPWARAGDALVEMADAGRAVTGDDGECRSLDECTCPPTRAAREKCPAWRWKGDRLKLDPS